MVGVLSTKWVCLVVCTLFLVGCAETSNQRPVTMDDSSIANVTVATQLSEMHVGETVSCVLFDSVNDSPETNPTGFATQRAQILH